MKEFDRLVEILKLLRSPKGCPWDRAQKIKDYERYLLEETYELVDAIRSGRPDQIREELGDLYLILTMICQLFAERKKFNASGALRAINAKLVARHPHVFSRKRLGTKEEVLKYWVKAKAKKKNRKTVKDRLPKAAPALFIAEVLMREISYMQGKKFNPEKISREALSAVRKNLASFPRAVDKGKSLSDVLLALCQLSAACKIDLETTLHQRVMRLASKTPYQKHSS